MTYEQGSDLFGFNPYCSDFIRVRTKGWISCSIRIFIDSLGFLHFISDFTCYHSPPPLLVK